MTRPRNVLASLDPWAWPPLLMGMIFLLSAQPDLTTGLGTIDLIARKIAHATEFGLLAYLWWRALREVAAPGPALASAGAVAIAYATLDEFHQTFVSGRHGAPVDVAIDCTGIAIALAIALRASRAPLP